MRLVADQACAPTPAGLDFYRGRGITGLGGYIGGDTPCPWHHDSWAQCAAAGFLLLPIWVAYSSSHGREAGAQAGNEALIAMQERELSGVLVLDIESGYDVDRDWSEGFALALQAGECDLALYGTGARLLQLTQLRVFTWITRPLSTLDIPPDVAGIQLLYAASYDLSFFDAESTWATYNGELP